MISESERREGGGGGGADPYPHTADMASSFSALGFGGASGCTNGTKSDVSTNTEGREQAQYTPNLTATVPTAIEELRCNGIGRGSNLKTIHAHCCVKLRATLSRVTGTHAP
jgi:hypothetical protein